jgi:hypothetical protein
MTVSNYIEVDELRAYLNDQTFLDEQRMEWACNAASRSIDAVCGRYFYQQQETQYYSPSPTNLWAIDFDDMDVATTSGLVVSIETGNDGTYPTTLTYGTDFLLEPVNQSSNGINPWPYTSMRSLTGRIFPIKVGPFWRDTVKVVATYGWPAVPDAVKQATFISAALLYKMTDAPFGNAGFGEYGVLRVRDNPIVTSLLGPYRKMSTVGFGLA